MIAPASPDLSLPPASRDWVTRLPEGAVSLESDGTHLVLRASQSLQSRYEELLKRSKAKLLTEDEARDYTAICELDEALSALNRIARGGARK